MAKTQIKIKIKFLILFLFFPTDITFFYYFFKNNPIKQVIKKLWPWFNTKIHLDIAGHPISVPSVTLATTMATVTIPSLASTAPTTIPIGELESADFLTMSCNKINVGVS